MSTRTAAFRAECRRIRGNSTFSEDERGEVGYGELPLVADAIPVATVPC